MLAVAFLPSLPVSFSLPAENGGPGGCSNGDVMASDDVGATRKHLDVNKQAQPGGYQGSRQQTRACSETRAARVLKGGVLLQGQTFCACACMCVHVHGHVCVCARVYVGGQDGAT